MSSILSIIQQRRLSTYQKLRSRFLKSLRTRKFKEKSSRDQKNAIDQLKGLESRLGLKSGVHLAHWALAMTLGLVTISAQGQDQDREQRTPFRMKRKTDEASRLNRTSAGEHLLGTSAIPLFNEGPFLGDPWLSEGIFTGDFDGDGDEDMLVYFYYNEVRIFLNDGTGQFPTYYTLLDGTPGLEGAGIADIDGDGDLDIILPEVYEVANDYANKLITFRNNGTGQFTRTEEIIQGIEFEGHLNFVDLDGDLDLDFIAYVDPYLSLARTSVYLNDGTGVFTKGDSIYNWDGAVGQFDGDGDVDIVFTQGSVDVHFNDGAGNFTDTANVSIPLYSYIPNPAVGDIDNDGDDDIVLAEWRYLTWLNNDGTGNFVFDTLVTTSITPYGYIGLHSPKITDIDNDGDLDIVAFKEYEKFEDNQFIDSDSIFFLLNNNDGTFTEQQERLNTNVLDAEIFRTFDADGDGDEDILLSSYFDIVIFQNTAQNFTTLEEDLILAVYGLGAAFEDVDGDGDIDVINSGLTQILKNDGLSNLTISQNIVRESGLIAGHPVTGDFDLDGDVDVVFQNYDFISFNPYLWRNDGTGTFTKGDSLGTGNVDLLYNIAAVDLDEDGDLDIVGAGYNFDSTFYLNTWDNDGAGNFTIIDSKILPVETDKTLDIADVNNDGHQDVILGSNLGVMIFQNDVDSLRSGALNADSTAAEFFNLAFASFGDIDGDGDIDLLAFNDYAFGGPENHLKLINDGTGTFTFDTLNVVTSNYGGALVADFDLDGDVDLFLAGGDYYNDEFWENDGTGTFSLVGTLESTSYNPSAGDIDGDGDIDIFANEYYQSSRLIFNTTNQAQVDPGVLRAADSSALVTIYNGTGGTEWINNSNWLSGSLDTWNGVTVVDDRVTSLNLSANNLVGDLPDPGSGLEVLETVDVSDNELTSIPDVTGLVNLTSFDASGNPLDFASIEPNVGNPVTFDNLKPFGVPSETVIAKTSNYTVQAPVGGTANTYQWQFRNDSISVSDQTYVNVPGATSNTYSLTDINYLNMGKYKLVVQNTIATGITIESQPQEVLALGSIDFIPAFEYKDGSKGTVKQGESNLFKIVEDGPYDTTAIVTITNEQISFTEIVLGNYLLNVNPTDGYTEIKDIGGGDIDTVEFIPTYYVSTIDWVEADTLLLRDFLSDSLFIQRIPPPEPEPGEGTIALTVEDDFPDEPDARIDARRRVKKAGCSLRRRTSTGGGKPAQDAEFVLVAYKETDDNGQVTFGELPNGLYRLNIQYPGIPMDPDSFVEFEINTDEGVAGYELAATVTEDGIVVEQVLGLRSDYFKDLNIYPVPAEDKITISYRRLLHEGVKVRLLNLTGQEIMTRSLEAGNRKEFDLNVSGMEGGIYILQIFNETEGTLAKYKIIIRN